MKQKAKSAMALLDPASVYAGPNEVVDDDSLSREQKIKILRRWEYDARELQVAEEEGLPGGEAESNLDAVLAALQSLDAGHDTEHSPPTKQGGA